jgi:hypothetical protein
MRRAGLFLCGARSAIRNLRMDKSDGGRRGIRNVAFTRQGRVDNFQPSVNGKRIVGGAVFPSVHRFLKLKANSRLHQCRDVRRDRPSQALEGIAAFEHRNQFAR